MLFIGQLFGLGNKVKVVILAVWINFI